jgi:hypothetical protein
MVVGAVGLGAAREVVSLDSAGEALALAHARHVDQVALGEHLDGEALADLVAIHVVRPELPDLGDRRKVLELALPGLVELLRRLDAELHGRVPVPLHGAEACDGVGLDRDGGDRDHRPVRLEDLCHADLAADQSDAHRGVTS